MARGALLFDRYDSGFDSVYALFALIIETSLNSGISGIGLLPDEVESGGQGGYGNFSE